MFGGSLGNYDGNIPSFDGGCVDNPFRWCDNLSNNDPNVLTFMSKAFANTTVRMAFDSSAAHATLARRRLKRVKPRLKRAAASAHGHTPIR